MFSRAVMISALAVLPFLAATTHNAPPVQAGDACKERFVELLVGGNQGAGPTRIYVKQQFGKAKSENYFYSMGAGSADGMMEPIKGMGPTWVLFRDQKMYMSSDKGKNWKFGRKLDKASDPEVVKATLRKDSETTTKAACGEEALDGVMHDTVEGQYVSTALQGATSFQKYWINRKTGWMTKAYYRSKMAGQDSISTQMIEPAPGLELPKPE